MPLLYPLITALERLTTVTTILTISLSAIFTQPHSLLKIKDAEAKMTRSSLDSVGTSPYAPKKKSRSYSRSLSASECALFPLRRVLSPVWTSLRIARNTKNFETWCSHQSCEEVAFSDLPSDFTEYVDIVFNTRGRLPAEWMDKV